MKQSIPKQIQKQKQEQKYGNTSPLEERQAVEDTECDSGKSATIFTLKQTKRRKRITLYLAGPLFSLAERMFNCVLANELRKRGYEVFVPQEFCADKTSADEIATQCKLYLSEADAVIINLDGADADSGTAFEAGMAQETKTTIGFRTDFRKSGDDSESGGNIVFRLLDSIVLYNGSKVSELVDSINTVLQAKYRA